MNSAELRRLLTETEQRETRQTLDEICAAIGIGLGTLQSRDRSADVARRRAVFCWIARTKLDWPNSRTARAIRRTERQVYRMLRTQRPATENASR